MNKRIRFRSQEYVLTEGGVIATAEALENFTASFACLEDGRIMRHGEVIGRQDDIEVLGDSDVHATVDGFLRNAFNPQAWPELYGADQHQEANEIRGKTREENKDDPEERKRLLEGRRRADRDPPTRRIREGD